MKNMNFFASGAAIVAVAAALSACSSDDSGRSSDFPKDKIVRVVADVNAPATRGIYTNDNLQSFGFSIVNPADNSYTYTYDNIRMNLRGDEWISAGDKTMLWRNSSDPVNIAAYAPYYEATGGVSMYGAIAREKGFNVEVQPVQTKDDPSSDFLAWHNTDFVPSRDLVDGKVQVNFHHVLSQFTIELRFGTEFDLTTEGGKITSNPVEEITIDGTALNASYSFPDDEIKSPSGFGSVQPYCNDDFTAATSTSSLPGHEITNAKVSYTCILIPQTVSDGNLKIGFAMRDKYYTWTAPADLAITFKPGKRHRLVLNVGRDVVVPDAFTVEPWSDTPAQDFETL